MDATQVMGMDPYMLISWLNMKLRDEYGNLAYLCEEYGLSIDELEAKLRKVEYVYNPRSNQFISIEA